MSVFYNPYEVSPLASDIKENFKMTSSYLFAIYLIDVALPRNTSPSLPLDPSLTSI